jgi:spore germination protein KC
MIIDWRASMIKNYITFSIKIMTCMFLILILSGCWDSKELDTLAVIIGSAIDKGEAVGEIVFTAQIVNSSQIGPAGDKGSSSENAKTFWNAKSTGITISDTIRKIVHQSSRRLFFPHNQVLVFSQDIAREGIGEYIDFFIRNNEYRLDNYLLISESTAGEVFNVKSELEMLPASGLSKLLNIQYMASEVSVLKLDEFAVRLMSKTAAPIAAFVETIVTENGKINRVNGSAVFKKDKLAGTLSADETRGLLWVIGKVRQGTDVLNLADGNHKTTVSILNSSSKIYPESRNDSVTFKVMIKCDFSVDEIPSDIDLTHPEIFIAIQKAEEDIIRKEAMDALKKARELKADIFGFGEELHRKDPESYNRLKDRWDEVFQNAEVEISIEALLRGTGKITNSIME